MRGKPKLDPDAIYVCVESFNSSDPEHGACARGIQLHGNHPTVVKRPQYFVLAPASEDEISRAALALYPDGVRLVA